ncbi:MAG: double-strand break repair protein AddB [Rhodospirillales bacterium]|nr:double-strand break repair protein AddB [Rhodospirillales bacterium]
MSEPRSSGIFTIASGVPFADALASGLLARLGPGPLALADAQVFLPTRRGARALAEAFLRRTSGRPTVLPSIRTLGDADEDELIFAAEDEAADGLGADLPPAIGELRRLMLLARLVRADPTRHAAADQAAGLARELARLLDHAETERLDFADLKKLAPEEFAVHWQKTLEFLRIVTEAWPAALAEEGRLGPADRRNRLLAARAQLWRAAPPSGLVAAAGPTGSVPATADLLETILALPRGFLVLPGLDRELDDAAWNALEPSHPQFGMARLLKRLGIERAEVRDWDAPGLERPAPHRARLAAEALRPAASGPPVRPVHAQALDGVTRVDCPTPHEEAGVVSLVMREALEKPGRTCALVTPDRALARRVAAELGRFGIEVDDSAGVPLDQTPPGIFLRLLVRAASESFAPVPLLALLKHPLAACGFSPAEFRARVRAFERAALRGPRPAPGLAGLAAAAAGKKTRERETVAAFADATRAFAELVRAPSVALKDLVASHVAAAEALAVAPQGAHSRDRGTDGATRLWAGAAGAAAADFAAELLEAADALGAIEGPAYPALLESLMAGRVVRPLYGLHPRVHIWGPLEARLQHADILILGGLNEGTWPPEAAASPWMSRPMMTEFGLPSPERRVGLSAHDFVQAFAAPRVVLTRAERIEGTPTVPSRWLQRIANLVKGTECDAAFTDPRDWTRWQAELDKPAALIRAPRPEPRPPIAARPRELSVTRIETWMRDPYAIYAEHILGLKALDSLDAEPDAADYGTFIHTALERFVGHHPLPAPLPADAETRLLAFGREALAAALDRPGIRAFWWPRFERIARWFVAAEAARRAGGALAASATEAKGKIAIPGPAGPFRLTAKADRIDRDAAGRLVILDYKTGAPPTKDEVAAGFAPQLPLEAMIAEAGGFAGVAAGAVAKLEYWRLKGGDPVGEIRTLPLDPAQLIAEAREGLSRLVAAFDDPATPYEARPRPDKAPRFSDYEHLARIKDWAAGEGGDS